MSENNRPIATKTSGNVIMSIWENDGSNGKYYTYSFQKAVYKQGEDTKYYNNFSKADMPHLAMLVQDTALKNINARMTGQNNQGNQAPPPQDPPPAQNPPPSQGSGNNQDIPF